MFLYATGFLLVVGIFAGFIFSSGVGISIAIGGLFVSFFACMMLQTTRPARIIDKWMLSKRMSGKVVRRESASRIVLDDPGYLLYKKEMSKNGSV